MKITLIELNPQHSMATYQLALTSISNFFLFSEVATTQQTDSIVYKCYNLKPLERGKRSNSCIRVNIRELNRELYTR